MRRIIKKHSNFHHIYYELDRIISMLLLEDNTVLNPRAFVLECYDTFKSTLTPRMQHDICEFLMALIDIGSITPNNTPVPKNINAMMKVYMKYKDVHLSSSPLGKLTTIQIITQLQCTVCEKKTHAFEHSTTLIVPIPSVSDSGSIRLLDLIERSFEREGNRDWKCGDGNHQKGVLSRLISVLPKILIVCMSRFDSNMKKINTSVMIDGNINLDDVVILGTDKTEYDLCAIACHSGTSIDYGHYYAIGKREDGTWVRYDDECKTVYDRDVKGIVSNEAYLAFYVKR